MNNRRRIILEAGGALLLALLMATVAWAGWQGHSSSTTPSEKPWAASLEVTEVVSGTISYQGRLVDSGGEPVDGTRTLDFRLYGQQSGGTPLWSQTETVIVEDGLFNVYLAMDPAHVDGRALWLGVQVQGDAQEMAPRQPLLPVPYALSLRPGAGISGTIPGVPTLNVMSEGIGLASESTSSIDPRDPAILGVNLGSGPGVEGQSVAGPAVLGHGVDSAGLFGVSERVVGVHGESIDGHGGFFTSTNTIGMEAHTLSLEQGDAAILGINEGMGHGVEGQSNWGFGVRGFSTYAPGIQGESIYASAAVFSSTHGPGIVVEGAGQEGLAIYDTVGGDYIAAGGILAPDFRVAKGGDVFADGAYNCGLGPGAEPGTCVVQNSPADFAEMLAAREGLEPGDVLAIGSDGRLCRSSEAYQSTVIGVYSTQPGYLGNGHYRGQEGYAPLAMVGVVPVKVSGENGAVGPGDLLVASATPGHAMKADASPAVGTVIGKALEGLEAGTGVIRMLVMLQ